VVADGRPTYFLFGLGSDLPRCFIYHLRKLLHRLPDRFWSRLSGGSDGLRRYIPNLSETIPSSNPLYLVQQEAFVCMDFVFAAVQAIFPLHTHTKISILHSRPGAPSQFDGRSGRLHSDYPQTVYARPPDQRPISVILALDPFSMEHLSRFEDSEEQRIVSHVRAGEVICFTNHCLHAEGANNTEEDCYRVFAYMAQHQTDIPQEDRIYTANPITDRPRQVLLGTPPPSLIRPPSKRVSRPTKRFADETSSPSAKKKKPGNRKSG